MSVTYKFEQVDAKDLVPGMVLRGGNFGPNPASWNYEVVGRDSDGAIYLRTVTGEDQKYIPYGTYWIERRPLFNEWGEVSP